MLMPWMMVGAKVGCSCGEGRVALVGAGAMGCSWVAKVKCLPSASPDDDILARDYLVDRVDIVKVKHLTLDPVNL